jgi:glutamate dehydrogenase
MEKNATFSTVNGDLTAAIEKESKKFQETYLWLEKSMSPAFFNEVGQDNALLITRSLMGFHLQGYFSTIHLKDSTIVMCLDSDDADLKILKDYSMHGIKNYETFVSNAPLPIPGVKEPLRIATLYFTDAIDTRTTPYPVESKENLKNIVKERIPLLDEQEFNKLVGDTNNRFLKSVLSESLVEAVEVYARAKTRDSCQYEVTYNREWQEKGTSSLQVVLAWKNVPKFNFLYRLARIIYRHDLTIKRVNATYIDPSTSHSILIMVLEIHGQSNQAAWDAADVDDFLRELVTSKYFASFDLIDEKLVGKHVVSGNMGNLLRAMINFIHQALVHLDVNLYTLENIEEALCRHPELTSNICAAFQAKFDPKGPNIEEYQRIRENFLADLSKLDTGQTEYDVRRKNVLTQAMNLVHYTLKTNFFRKNFTALSFRLNPSYINELPFEGIKKFPLIPYGIFFIKGMHFFGFHIRFKDLSRGGLRTVYPELLESEAVERNNVFTECYNLAYTQHMKNKDIPEGGAKGIIFLKPFERIEAETGILEKELQILRADSQDIKNTINSFKSDQKSEHLYQAQRAFIENLLTIVNCDPDGKILATDVVDYLNRPEYLYLGPDENMHDSMIKWIANYSARIKYKPGSSFMSGKPQVGINHKEYGVTSLGINVYMEEILKFLGIDPNKDIFTVKMSGGPDGDVAGNQIHNLYRFYPKTAKLLALTDVTGTINDPSGLDLEALDNLFKNNQGIRYYPPEKLNPGGFLLDRSTRRSPSAFVQQTLCWRNVEGTLVEDWISGSDMNAIFRNNVHQTVTDVFIPSGGRPRTLNEENFEEFLDETGKPTAKAIVEGANLYLTAGARKEFEKRGVLIVKDSSANKGGVICSSYEVLSGLTLGDDLFYKNKETLVQEILIRIKQCALNEAQLLLRTHKQTGQSLPDLSAKISDHINQFTYNLLDHLDKIKLSDDINDPSIKCFLNYCLPTLSSQYTELLMKEIPEHHKKAIIARHIAANLVYRKGLSWFPSVVDIFPVLIAQFEHVND